MIRWRSASTVVALVSLVLVVPAAAAPPAQSSVLQTFSERVVLNQGLTVAFLLMNIPSCGSGQAWLLKNIQVSPEIETGATGIDLPELPPWGVSAIVHQNFTSGTGASRPVTMIADGPTHMSTSIEGGQAFGGSVRVQLLGQAMAPARFEFNVHVTGQCGIPSLMAP